MKHSILSLLSVVLLLFSSHTQAQLSQGDIVVVGLNPVSDTVHLVPLVDIPAGTTVVITDVGWLSTNAFHASLTGDGRATWTTTALVPKGSLIKLVLGGLDNTPATELTNLTTSASYTSQVVFSGYTVNDPILVSGDQIFIYQGLASNPSFIFGLNNSGGTVGADNWNTVDTPTLTISRLPNGTGSQNSLTNGVNAIGLPGGGSQQDNVQYTGPTTATDRATWLTRFTASANWTGDNTGSTATSITPGTGIVIATPTTITSLNRVNTSPSNAGTVNWTLTFAAPVTGVTASNFSLSGAAATGASVGTPTTSNGGLTWNVPVTTGSTDGTLTLSVANATGMTPSVSTSLPFAGEIYTMDKTAPTATIVVADTSLIAGETSLVTITFSEAVTGFTNADLTIANGTLSAVSSGDGGVTWTATLTPTASLTDSTNVITLTNTGVTDVLGNAGVGTTNSNNYAIDTQRPTAGIVVTDTNLGIGETSLVTITFSEAVTGFTNADLTIANGTLSAVSSSNGGITWAATFTPAAGVTDSSNVITLALSGVADAAGNAGTGTTDSNNYSVDTERPTILISAPSVSTIAAGAGSVTYTVSYSDTNFNSTTLANGNVTLNTTGTANGTVNVTGSFSTRTVTISSITGAGTLGITIAAGTATDGAGNSALGAGPSSTFTVLAPPTITTGAASSITTTSAVLNGSANANGSNTTLTYEWGLTTSYGNTVSMGTTTGAPSSIPNTLNSLTPGTTYHFRLVGISAGGTTNGADQSFTTLSNNADLSALVVNTATISPVFGAATTAYTASVSNSTANVTVTPTRAQANATIEARSNANAFASVTSGSPSGALALNPGSNTIEVRVTAQDGTPKTYTTTVTRRSILQDWRFDNFAGDFSGSANMANGLDFDSDGKTNLLEFAFGTDPTSGSSGPFELTMTGTYAAATFGTTGQPIVKLEPITNGVDFRAVFIRRVDHAAAGLTYTPEFSGDNFTSFTASATAPTVLATSGSYQLVSVPYPHFLSNGKKARFFRVSVSIAP